MKVHQLWWVSGVRGGARGWNADQFGQALASAASTALLLFGVWGVWKAVGVGGLVVGTLLGPEGTGRPVGSGTVMVFVIVGRVFASR